MSKHRPNTTGFLKKIEERGKPMLLVGAEDLSDPKAPYRGPVAEVTWDDTWLNITTDKYEGHAMLNIEALPYLRRALAQIERARKASR
jgi:hypothetical protein